MVAAHEANKSKRQHKTQVLWHGPYEMISTLSPFVYNCRLVGQNKIITVHVDRIKRFASTEFQMKTKENTLIPSFVSLATGGDLRNAKKQHQHSIRDKDYLAAANAMRVRIVKDTMVWMCGSTWPGTYAIGHVVAGCVTKCVRTRRSCEEDQATFEVQLMLCLISVVLHC